ncbi:hypothetical protein AMTRI_Chr13g119070 [Amborella trichopoda]
MTPRHSLPSHSHFRCKVFYKIFKITHKQVLLCNPMILDHKDNTTASFFSTSMENLDKNTDCKLCSSSAQALGGHITTYREQRGSIIIQPMKKKERMKKVERECKYCHLVFETFEELGGHMPLHRNRSRRSNLD